MLVYWESYLVEDDVCLLRSVFCRYSMYILERKTARLHNRFRNVRENGYLGYPIGLQLIYKTFANSVWQAERHG